MSKKIMEQSKKANEGSQPSLNVDLPEEVAEGTYSNLAMIAHSNTEFVVDFLRMMPGLPKPIVKSRIILTPEHAIRFLNALKDNIEKYEDSFGSINMPDSNEVGNVHLPFGGPMGQA